MINLDSLKIDMSKGDVHTLSQFASSIAASLGPDLETCILYGSAVRGGFQKGRSDVNILIILKHSSPVNHLILSKVVSANALPIELLVVEHSQFSGTVRSFAAKFSSIRRNYTVLCGVDHVSSISLEPELERALSEQTVRNLGLRLVHNFITLQNDRRKYSAYVFKILTALITDLSAVMRCRGIVLPNAHSERIPVIQSSLNIDTSVLSELLDRRAHGNQFSSDEVLAVHTRLYAILDAAICGFENQ